MGRESAGLSGHWRDELIKLKAGLNNLRGQRDGFRPDLAGAGPSITHVPIRKIQPGKELVVRATIGTKEILNSVRVGFRQGKNDYKWVDMKNTEPLIYRAVIKSDEVTTGLGYLIEAIDSNGRQTRHEPISVIVTDDDKAPRIKHERVTGAIPGSPLIITAQVHDPSGVKWVRLRYRNVTQFQDYKMLEMTETDNKGQYKAIVPGQDIEAKWDFMYLIEVMDNNGNGSIYPDMEKEVPYIMVRLIR